MPHAFAPRRALLLPPQELAAHRHPLRQARAELSPHFIAILAYWLLFESQPSPRSNEPPDRIEPGPSGAMDVKPLSLTGMLCWSPVIDKKI
jgi:hypothetical protein